MKILVISQTTWRNENNSGNTLTNLFRCFPGEFANIYCSEGEPSNSLCKEYFQITDQMIVRHILKHEKVGKVFRLGHQQNNQVEFSPFDQTARKHKNPFLLLLREAAWNCVRYDSAELYSFIENFKPDIIYAPSFGTLHMQKLVRKIKTKTGLPLVSLISDDLYAYSKNDRNIFSLLNKFLLRRSMKKTFSMYDLIYTMTEEQKMEYERIFNRPIHILRKNASVDYEKHKIGRPIRWIYAGGLYQGRDQMIIKLAKIIEQYSEQDQLMELNIYCNSVLSDSILGQLDLLKHTVLHKAIGYEELIQEYKSSDIALHIESFDPLNASQMRLSFSTKIVDCLQSGCAVVAICPEDNSGYKYLKCEDAAICISDPEKIKFVLDQELPNLAIWQDKAYGCLQRNHDPKKNTEKMVEEFTSVLNKAK